MIIHAYKFNKDSPLASVTFNGGFLKLKYSGESTFGTNELLNRGVYRLQGWEYDFKPYLKRYYYFRRNYGAQIAYAPNKTLLKKAVGARLYLITEIKRGG